MKKDKAILDKLLDHLISKSEDGEVEEFNTHHDDLDEKNDSQDADDDETGQDPGDNEEVDDDDESKNTKRMRKFMKDWKE